MTAGDSRIYNSSVFVEGMTGGDVFGIMLPRAPISVQYAKVSLKRKREWKREGGREGERKEKERREEKRI